MVSFKSRINCSNSSIRFSSSGNRRYTACIFKESRNGDTGAPFHCLFSSVIDLDIPDFALICEPFAILICPTMPTCPPTIQFSPILVLPETPDCDAITVLLPISTLCAI